MGINVNAISPGPIATDAWLKANSNEMVSALKSASPFHRLGEPKDIANVFMFLCSDESSWVAGQILMANGAAVV